MKKIGLIMRINAANRQYDASFKAEILKMVSDGRPAGKAAQALGNRR